MFSHRHVCRARTRNELEDPDLERVDFGGQRRRDAIGDAGWVLELGADVRAGGDEEIRAGEGAGRFEDRDELAVYVARSVDVASAVKRAPERSIRTDGPVNGVA